MSATLEEAIAHHQSSNYTLAEDAYLKILNADNDNSDVHHLLSILYGQQNILDKAEHHINKALSITPDESSYYTSLANIKKYQGDMENAVKSYQKSISLNKNNPAAYYNLSLLYLKKQQSSQAIKNLQLAIKYKSNYDDAYIVLIQHYFEINEVEKANEMLEHAEKFNFSNPKFMKLLALKHHSNNKHKDAIELLNKYINELPDDYSGYHHLAAAHLQDGDIEAATKNYTIAIKLNESHHQSHHNLAVIYLTQNKLDLALKHWLQALSAEINIDYLYNTAVVYNYKGQYSNALTYFEKCLEKDSNHYNSIANIAVIYLKKNMPVEAKFYFKKALEIKPDDEQTLYMLAALDGNSDNFQSAPTNYVSDLFDQYANTFEDHLTKVLQYKAPQVIYDFLSKHTDIENAKNLDVCDIGCGTGFMGEKLSEHCRLLVGIDLAEKMLDKARSKNIYSELIKADICSYLKNEKDKYDYITAADVVPYYGDVKDLFSSCNSSLKTSGYFVFSVEENKENNFQLQANGRFNHKLEYINNIAKSNGFTIKATAEHSTRKEGKNDIPCLIFLLQKN